ncbi:beta-N-acetylhexosaminidase [Paenibacillus sp. CMAA1364]
MNLHNLTLKQKIGQMFICGFDDLVPNHHITELIQDHHVGGIIYFRRNIDDLDQVSQLSSSLQEIAMESDNLPLWIAIDQEGGMVTRIDHKKMSRIPGNMALGATTNPEYTYKVSTISAEEMIALGLNVNFAPCLDVNNNARNPVIGVRSFGEDPDLVSEHGAAVIKAFQDKNLSAAAKHFPGHGDTSVDSHLGLAEVPHTRDRLDKVELKPFIRAIEEGVDMIMTAHVIFPAIEPVPIPATLSKAVLTGLLREELGFEGIIVTDCLEMHAIAKYYGIAEGAVKAIEAGADCVLVSHTLSDQIDAINAVNEAVQSGRIAESVIDLAVDRILNLKEKRLQHINITNPKEFVERGQKEEIDHLLYEVACNSITLVKDSGLIPIAKSQSVLVIWPEVRQETQVDEPWTDVATLGQTLASYIDNVEEIRISATPVEEEINHVLQAATSVDQVIFVTYTSGSQLPAGQRELAERLTTQQSNLIVASTRNPYDLNDIPAVPTYLCCYENTPYFMEALASILVGKDKAEGTLPVTLQES